jgi:hypothetical protein
MFAAAHLVAQMHGNRAPGSTEIASAVSVPMDLTFQKPVVEARINGKGPFRFFLDTGAGGTVLNDDLVAELALPVVGTARMGDPANPGAIQVDQVQVDAVQIGDATVRDITASSWDRTTLYGGVPNAPRGVLGLPLFRDCLLTLDYPTQAVRIEKGALPGADAAHVIAYETDESGQLPVIPLEVGGLSLQAHLDSGNMGGLSLPKSYADRLSLMGEPEEVGQGRTVASTFTIWRATLNGDVLIAGNRIEKPEIYFNDGMKHVNVGYDILRRFAVTLDQENQRMRLTEVRDASGQVAAAPKAKRYGIRIAPGDRQDALTVAGVDADSAAQRAGLQAGDRITTVNGKAVASMSFSDTAHAMRSSPITLTVQRGDETLEIRMSLDESPPAGS